MSAVFDPGFDGHTHTEFCPHGSGEPLAQYLDRAVALGLTKYAVTEHIPLPHGFVDPFGRRECAGEPEELLPYLAEAERQRDAFAGRLDVRVGLEIDYLGAAQGGWHDAILQMLAPVWSRLDPEATILSLHFLANVVIDGTPEMTASGLLAPGEPPDVAHLRYYAVLKSALQASWTCRGVDLRPRRLGHLTLPRKFIKALPLREPERVLDAATEVLDLAIAEGFSLDFNTAGLDKADCGEVYLPEPLLSRAVALGATLVLGSDAHAPSEVGRHRDVAQAMVVATHGG